MSELPADLDALSTDDLRHQAFELAEQRHDLRFFWDLVRHLPASADVASEDASAGNITGSITETIGLVRELFGGGDFGGVEPMLRAHFIDYLRTHS